MNAGQGDKKVDVKNLVTFIHVAELNSFTKAANILGYSQSTVSFQIRQLETELNAQLFERINHTVALTEKGREVLGYAHQINKLAKEMASYTKGKDKIRGSVRLAMADSLCDSLLTEKYRDFRERYPDIELKIISTGTEEMFRLMNHNEVDAILTLDNHIYNAEYVIVKEEKVGVHFVAAYGHPCSGVRSVRELLEYPFLLTEKGMSYRRLMDEKLAEMSLEIAPVLEIGSAGLLCQLVEQGAGISFLPEYVTKREIEEGKMVRLDIRDFGVQVWKQLLYHRDKWVSPQMQAVMEYCISREFSQEIPEKVRQ